MERADAEATLIAHGFDPRFLETNARFFFLQALQKGPLELAEAFLVCGMSLRAKTDREPPIIKAAESGHLAHVELVLRYGGDLATRDVVDDTALHTAANWGHEKLIGELAALGASADTHNSKNWTPLSKAVKEGKTEIVEALLDAGADPDYAPKTAVRPLLFAQGAMLELLLARGASADIVYDDGTEDTFLLRRVAQKKVDEVRALLEHGAVDRPNVVGWTAHMVASDPARDVPPEIVELLEAHGATPGEDADTRLHEACSQGDLERVERLVAQGAPLDRVNRFGSTPLLMACTKSQWEVARWLLDAGADASIANVYANSALTFAVQGGDLRMVEALLAAGAPANEGIPHGAERPRSLALTIAGARGLTEIARRLIDAGADLASGDKFEQTAVFLAASKGHPETLRMLLEAGADPNVGGRETTSPLLIAEGALRAECVAILVEAGADLEHTEKFARTALHRVSDKYNNTKEEARAIAAALLDGGADLEALDGFDNTPFDLAMQSKNQPVHRLFVERLTVDLLERHTRRGAVDWDAVVAEVQPAHLFAMVHEGELATIEKLLEHGLDVGMLTWGPKPALKRAVYQTDPAMAERMLDAGADPHITRKGETLLMVAASAGHLGLVRRLLDAGVDVNAIAHDYPDTALTRAASKSVEVAKVLLEAGAEVDPVRGGWTPLMRAAQSGRLDVIELLLRHGANPNVLNSSRQIALEVARKNAGRHGDAHEAIMDRLASVSAVDVRDAQGRTSLFRAAMKGDLPTVTTLLAAGASANVPDDEGATPATVGALRVDVAAALGVAHAPLALPKRRSKKDPFRALRRSRSPELVADLADTRNPRGDTVLHLAVLLGDEGLVEAALAAGVDVHAKNEVGDTPWSLAIAAASHLEPRLRTAGAKIDIEQQVVTTSALSDLRTAIAAGDLRDVLRRIVDNTVNPHLFGPWSTPLEHAIADAAMLELLLGLGCDPETCRWSLWRRAAQRGATESLRTLAAREVAATPETLAEAMIEALARGPEPALVLAEFGAALPSPASLAHPDALRALVEVAYARGESELAHQATTELRSVLALRH